MSPALASGSRQDPRPAPRPRRDRFARAAVGEVSDSSLVCVKMAPDLELLKAFGQRKVMICQRRSARGSVRWVGFAWFGRYAATGYGAMRLRAGRWAGRRNPAAGEANGPQAHAPARSRSARRPRRLRGAELRVIIIT